MGQDTKRRYNDAYEGQYLSRVAFPLGGIGAGMICLEGTGALSHVSVRSHPDVFNEPCTFSAICIKGKQNIARVLEGPVPSWKLFGQPGAANGAGGKNYGLPRFSAASFQARFPFAHLKLEDEGVPLKVEIAGWSPFIPGDADNSSLPVAALEYHFSNPTGADIDAVFSFNARNFMATGKEGSEVRAARNGFILWQSGTEDRPWDEGGFCAWVDDGEARVNCAWFRGGWFDPLTVAWKQVQEGVCFSRDPHSEGNPSPGATIFVPVELGAGAKKTVRLMLCWYVPGTNLRMGKGLDDKEGNTPGAPGSKATHVPWYAGRFPDIETVAKYWRENYDELSSESLLFSQTFYDSTLPPEVLEAVASNLAILKSPTVLRQTDGRLWCWEGCRDSEGCCYGSCTHVWNYAQATAHLFPELERF